MSLLSSPINLSRLPITGDESTAAAALVAAYLHGQALAQIFDVTITPAMHTIGEMWFKGEISVADEHLATRTVLNSLPSLRAAMARADLNGLTAICCGIEGDLHELPVHLADVLLESDGWNTVNLGPNTPLFALRDMMVKERPQLICIAARSIADLHRATTEYEQLRMSAQKLETKVVIGGEAFRDPATRKRFSADAHPANFVEFVKIESKHR